MLFDIPEFENYLITKKGKIWSKKYKKFLKPNTNGSGYLRVEFRIDNKRFHRVIHRVLAKVFIPNPENKKEVNHKDGNKLNNKLSNLEWVSPRENMKHAFKIGIKSHRGEKHPGAKLSGEQVREIRKLAKAGKLKQAKIGEKFGILQTTVSEIKSGRLWPHIV
jgi:hypothetical protein